MDCCAISMGRRHCSLPGFPRPQIGFNYLGRFPAPGSGDWAAAAETVKLGGGDPALPLAHCIEVNALTADGDDGATLVASWSWAPALFSRGGGARSGAGLVRGAGSAGAPCRATRCRWPQPLRSAVAGAVAERDRAAGEQVPADGGHAAAVCRCRRGCCFMRFTMRRRRTSTRCNWCSRWRAPLDGAALEMAAQALVERHASLRAAFEHEKLSRPVQIIVAGARAPWRNIDLSLLDAPAREQRLADILLAGSRRALRSRAARRCCASR